MKSTADILREARALIGTPEKWTKDDTYGTYGCVCADGALLGTVNGFRTYGPPRIVVTPDYERAARLLVAAIGGDHIRDIHTFNDDPATTHADVLAAFDRAIALAETQA